MPSSRPSARSAKLSRSRRLSTSIGGSGGKDGGTNARTGSPATGMVTKRPRREAGGSGSVTSAIIADAL